MWMMPSYTTRRWAYVQVPEVGDTVRYMNDGFDGTVTHIRRRYVLMSDGTTFRKRTDMRKIWAWIVAHSSPHNRRSRSTVVPSETSNVTIRPLRPVTHYVRVVNLGN